MTEVEPAGASNAGGQVGPEVMMLSDAELADAVVEAVTSDVVAEAERDVLGDKAVQAAETDRITRLALDRRLVQLLRSTGFEGPDFDGVYSGFLRELIAYALPVMGSMVTKGTIFRESLRFRGRISKDARSAAALWTPPERQEAILDSVIEGCRLFLDYGLKGGRWDHRLGATLTTYFVGSCVCGFITVCNSRWKEDQVERAFIHSAPHREGEAGVYEETLNIIPASGPEGRDPADVAAQRDEIRRIGLKIKNPEMRQAFVLQADGKTQAEAAEELGLTRKTLERRTAQVRSKLRPSTMTNQNEDRG